MNHLASKLTFPMISTSPLQSQCCRGSPLAPSLHIQPWLSPRYIAQIIEIFFFIYHHHQQQHYHHRPPCIFSHGCPSGSDHHLYSFRHHHHHHFSCHHEPCHHSWYYDFFPIKTFADDGGKQHRNCDWLISGVLDILILITCQLSWHFSFFFIKGESIEMKLYIDNTTRLFGMSVSLWKKRMSIHCPDKFGSVLLHSLTLRPLGLSLWCNRRECAELW